MISFKVVPNSWRELVSVRKEYRRRFTRPPRDPALVTLLKGKTIFIKENWTGYERKLKLAPMYRLASTHSKMLHAHTHYDIDTDISGFIVWMD